MGPILIVRSGVAAAASWFRERLREEKTLIWLDPGCLVATPGSSAVFFKKNINSQLRWATYSTQHKDTPWRPNGGAGAEDIRCAASARGLNMGPVCGLGRGHSQLLLRLSGSPCGSAVKSSQGLLLSEAAEAIKPYAEAAGYGRRSWYAWVWTSLPPGLSKEPVER